MTKVILTDIEGTTSSLSFVHETLFPYARARLPAYVAEHGGDLAQLLGWMDADAKVTELKDAGPRFAASPWLAKSRKPVIVCAMTVWTLHAGYDPEAQVWYTLDCDVPGLVTEGDTLEHLRARDCGDARTAGRQRCAS